MADDDTIRKRLAKLDVDYNSLRTGTKQYINQIDDYFERCRTERETAREMLKHSKASVLSVSEDINCSRTTLYKDNQLLKKYIDLHISELDKAFPIDENKKLKNSNEHLQKKIALMEARDLDFELLKAENATLKQQLKDKNADIERLRSALVKASNHKNTIVK